MAITKERKKEMIETLESAIKGADSMVFVNFHGLPVAESTALRGSMHASDIDFKVVKKTLLKRALSSSTISGEIPELDGEIAVAWANDLIAPARLAQEFSNGHKEQFKIVGGIFDGRYMSQSEMMEIATIPDTPVLRGMFVNVINSPIQGLVIALNAIAESRA